MADHETICDAEKKTEYPHDPGEYLTHKCILSKHKTVIHRCYCWYTWKDEK